MTSKDDWYKHSLEYWNNQDATNKGVLSGFEEVHEPDIKTSFDLMTKFKHKFLGLNSAIDMGAGIGRISKAVLTKCFKEVDLLEPSETQIA